MPGWRCPWAKVTVRRAGEIEVMVRVDTCYCCSHGLNKEVTGAALDVESISKHVEFADEGFGETCSGLFCYEEGRIVVGEDVGVRSKEGRSFE